jgi:hypothetical protein
VLRETQFVKMSKRYLCFGCWKIIGSLVEQGWAGLKEQSLPQIKLTGMDAVLFEDFRDHPRSREIHSH